MQNRRLRIHRQFQWRYTWILLVALLTAFSIAALPLYHLMMQNYDLFIRLGYERLPSLIQDLERERVWLNLFSTAGLLALVTFCLIFGFRQAENLVKPLDFLEYRIRQMTRGQLSNLHIHIRKRDEFKELIEAFNCFQISLCAHIEDEIKRLQQCLPYVEDPQSHQLLVSLIEFKAKQLGVSLPIDDSASELHADSATPVPETHTKQAS